MKRFKQLFWFCVFLVAMVIYHSEGVNGNEKEIL